MRPEQLFRGKNPAPQPPDPMRPLRFLIHLPNFIKLYVRLFRDKRVPLFPKVLLVGALLYVVSPIDVLSEITIPFVGVIDDVAIIALALRAFIPLCPRNVVEEHVRRIDIGQ
ncbi:MAG: YkvA family protein [Candidatus Zipacnadales bacterium]